MGRKPPSVTRQILELLEPESTGNYTLLPPRTRRFEQTKNHSRQEALQPEEAKAIGLETPASDAAD